MYYSFNINYFISFKRMMYVCMYIIPLSTLLSSSKGNLQSLQGERKPHMSLSATKLCFLLVNKIMN